MSSGVGSNLNSKHSSMFNDLIDSIDISEVKIEPQSVEIDQSLLDDLLAHRSKPVKPKTVKPGFFCVLCLRKCPPKSVVKFAPCLNSKAVDPAEAKRKLKQALDLEVDLEKYTMCLTCWKLVKLIADFKVCCWKAISNLEAFPTGLNGELRRDDGWMSEGTLDWIVRNYKLIWKHIELIDAQVEVSQRNRSVAPVEQIFIVPKREEKATEPEEPVIEDNVPKPTITDELLNKLPKGLVIKRTKPEDAKQVEQVSNLTKDLEDQDIQSGILDCVKECLQDEMIDDAQSDSTDSENEDPALLEVLEMETKPSKTVTSNRTTKRKNRERDLEDILSVLNESKTIAEEEAVALDLLATKPQSAEPVSKANIVEQVKLSQARGSLEIKKTKLSKKSSKKKEVSRVKKPSRESCKNGSGEIVTCVQSGEEMLHFLTSKPETPKIFTKRGVLNKEHQVQVKNLYEVLDVLTTSKISTEDETVALDLLATKAKIANPRRKKSPNIRPADVNELSDAALDEYMASVDEKVFQSGRKKSQAAEEAKHLEEDHYQVTICTCDICGRNFDGQHAVNVHKMRCKPDAPANEKYVSCPICTATFLDNSGLTFHVNRHKGIRPYKCRKFCDNTFFSNYTRIRHERKFCEREGRVCSICGQQLKNEASLTSHIQIVHGEAKFECKICGQKFRARKNFNEHRLVHSDERKHACPHCDKAFKVARSLKIHIRTHTNELPYACHMCEQRFNYKVSLHSHIERHHGPNDKW